MPTDERVDRYIAARAPFARPILETIRTRMHAACPDLEEAIKWGMPFFTLNGRPLANMAAFKAHASFGFWQRGEMPTGREGEAMGQFGQLRSVDDLPDDAEFAALVRKAVTLASDGAASKRPPRAAKPETDVPVALAEALRADEAAAAQFEAFSPGNRREYCEWIAEAKRTETQSKRVAEAIGWIREGKRRNWKYETR